MADKIHQADYALDTAVTLLEFYEDYFRIPYPLPKQGKDFAQFLQNEAFNDVSYGLYPPNWHSHGCLSALRGLELWQVSAVRLILLTPNRNRQFLIRAEAGLD